MFACLEIPFNKNEDSLETSQLSCIANHLTGFCIIRVLTQRFFWTEYSKFVNVPKSVLCMFQALISSDMNVNLWFSFSFWSVTSGTSRPEHSLFIYCNPKTYFEWCLVFKRFCFFWTYWRNLFTKKLCLRLPFLQRNLNWKSSFQKQLFCMSRPEKYETAF